MGLFGEECRKILGKRIVLFGAAALAGAIGIYLSAASKTDTVIDGVRYSGAQAVQKDREIASQWEGTLTMEKLYRMLDTYGAAVNEVEEDSRTRTGNWVSRFATDLLTDYPEGGNGNLNSSRELESLSERLQTYQPYFTYMDGFESVLLGGGTLAGIGTLFLIMIALTPVFAEEYHLKTSALLLSSVHGRKKDVRMKVTAALVLSGLFYLLANGGILLVFLAVYGGSAWKAGAVLTMQITGFSVFTCGEVWLMNLAWGLSGILMMAAITLFFSAICKTPFLALIWSLVSLAAAFVLLNTAPSFLSHPPVYFLFAGLGKWSPLYLPLTFGWGLARWEMPWRIFYVPGVIVLCLFAGQRSYKKYEA